MVEEGAGGVGSWKSSVVSMGKPGAGRVLVSRSSSRSVSGCCVWLWILMKAEMLLAHFESDGALLVKC